MPSEMNEGPPVLPEDLVDVEMVKDLPHASSKVQDDVEVVPEAIEEAPTNEDA